MRELFVVDGWVREEAPAGAQIERLPTPPEAFAFAGLVDMHAHTCWPHPPEKQVDHAAWMLERRAEYASNGVTLIRDMGSASEASLVQPDVPGLPAVQTCGTLLAPHAGFPFPATTDAELVERGIASIKRGAKWVKVFADWSHDFGGREDTAFTENDPVSYSPAVLAKLVAEAHARGARVAAHAFTPGGCKAAIEAGCDSLEHAWGVDEADLEAMRARGIAWVPLLGIAGEMYSSAVAHGGRERAAWIARSLDRLRRLLPLAERLGVVVLAGTDWHPQVLPSDEVAELIDAGLSRDAAFAAAATRAREFLHVNLSVVGGRDLVVVPADPRADPSVLERPLLVAANGTRVDHSKRTRRPNHLLTRLRMARSAPQ